jgi:hypothetical protein
MRIQIFEKIIKPNEKPEKKLLLELETGKVPEANEILNIEGTLYKVDYKIRMISDVYAGRTSTEYFIIECSQFTPPIDLVCNI